MATVIIQTQPTAASAIPGQNTTFTVVPSANFIPVAYTYQWKVNTVNISGATSSSYMIDPVAGDNTKSFTVLVNALSAGPSGNVSVANVTSNAAVLTVVAESRPFSNFAVYPETGQERFRRLRHLGYV